MNATRQPVLLALSFAFLACVLPSCGPREVPDPLSAPTVVTLEAMEQDPFYRLGFRRQWAAFPVIAEESRIQDIEPMGDVVLVHDNTGVFTLHAPAGGDVRWSTTLASPLTRFLGSARSGNKLFIASEADLFIVDVASGNLIDKQRFKRVVNTRPAMIGPVLVFGTANNAAMGHLTLNGLEAWAYTLAGPVTADPFPLGGNRVGLVSQLGQVVILDGTSGTSSAQGRIFDGINQNLGGTDGRLFVASLDQSVYCFDSLVSGPRWRVRTESPLKGTPVYADGRVFIEVPGRGLVALNADSGKELWTAKDITGSVIAIRKGNLIVYNGKSAALVAPADGLVIDEIPMPPLAGLVPDKFVDGNLYAASLQGRLVKFSPR